MTTPTHYLAVLMIALATTNPLQAQTTTPPDDGMRTLLGGRTDLHHGGWGAPTAHYTRIMDQDAMLVGLRGGWLIDHRVTIGIAGHGLVTPLRNTAYDAYLLDQGTPAPRPTAFHMGYGGLLIEPIIAYRSPVHISLPIMFGAGGCAYDFNTVLPEEDGQPGYGYLEGQAFFVVEPGIDLEMNVIPLVRLGISASYRYTSDLDLPATAKDALHGANVGVVVKIGRF